jgi:hypothetical protein
VTSSSRRGGPGWGHLDRFAHHTADQDGSRHRTTGQRRYPIHAYPRSLWPKWYRAPWERDEVCPCCGRKGVA